MTQYKSPDTLDDAIDIVYHRFDECINHPVYKDHSFKYCKDSFLKMQSTLQSMHDKILNGELYTQPRSIYKDMAYVYIMSSDVVEQFNRILDLDKDDIKDSLESFECYINNLRDGIAQYGEPNHH